MSQTPQARFDAAEDDRRLFVGPTDQVAVDRQRPVRPFSHDAARRIGIGLPPLFRDGIMIHHRIHISRRHEEAEPRLPENRNALIVFPVGLGDDPHAVAMGLQKPADDGVAEGRMIHIGIPDNIDKIKLGDAPLSHFFFRNR